jgi:hypothetical protein
MSGQMLERGDLAGIKLLILPSTLYISEPEIRQLDEWVRAGGVVMCEAHFASYNATTGRHARQTPGMGLVERWGIREIDSTSTHHLKVEQLGSLSGNLADDERKALKDSGAVGGEFVPVRLSSGATVWGGSRYAVLDAGDAETLGTFDGRTPTIVSKPIGRGQVIYCGTNVGLGAKREAIGLRHLLRAAAERAGISPTLATVGDLDAPDVHFDVLTCEGAARFIVAWNRSATPMEVTLGQAPTGNFGGVFRGTRLVNGKLTPALAGKSIELLARDV